MYRITPFFTIFTGLSLKVVAAPSTSHNSSSAAAHLIWAPYSISRLGILFSRSARHNLKGVPAQYIKTIMKIKIWRRNCRISHSLKRGMDFFHSAFFTESRSSVSPLALIGGCMKFDTITWISLWLTLLYCLYHDSPARPPVWHREVCVVFQSIASEMLFCVFSFDYAPHSLFINRARVNICVSHSRTYKRTQMSSVDKTRRGWD